MTERIRLLITNDSMLLGGLEILILQYLESLDRSKFDVHLVTLANRGVLLPDAKTRAEHYYCLNRKFALDLLAIWKLRRYIIRNKIDIVHTNNLWLDTLYVTIASVGLNIRKVGTVHGLWVNSPYVLIGLWLMRWFDRIIGVSNYVRLDLYKMGIPWEKVSVVYNCFNPQRFSPPLVVQKYSRDRPFRLIMVARFAYCKDQQTIIRAVRILLDRGYPVEVFMVGDGNQQIYQSCQSLVGQLRLQGVVHFCGAKRVNGEFLSQFDVFVASSRCETFGMAALEAMACGLPVIVSDIPALTELVEHGKYGLFFETGNPNHCADQVVKLIEDDALRLLLRQQGLCRSQNFRPNVVIKDLEQIYQQLMSNR